MFKRFSFFPLLFSFFPSLSSSLSSSPVVFFLSSCVWTTAWEKMRNQQKLRRVTLQWEEDGMLYEFEGKVDSQNRKQGQGQLKMTVFPAREEMVDAAVVGDDAVGDDAVDVDPQDADTAPNEHRARRDRESAERVGDSESDKLGSDDEEDGEEEEREFEFVLIQASFVDDVAQGRGELHQSSGIVVIGSFVDGEMTCDDAVEKDEDGRIVYEGGYKSGLRHGHGTLRIEDGGLVKGEFEDGEFVRDKCVYTYPTLDLTVPVCEPCENDLESCRLTEDPLEQIRVYVKMSPIEGSGEGLFAKVALKTGDVCSYYNGRLVPDREIESWDYDRAKNVISLHDDDEDLDVPVPFDSTSYYRASLGHKANHAPKKSMMNAKYGRVWHPRFGHIRCVQAIKDIAKDEEILVDYMYRDKDIPPWYPVLEEWEKT
eukprot:ANDGO_07544.mRNA.1 Histone-lysine N-methyltransferase SETD7